MCDSPSGNSHQGLVFGRPITCFGENHGFCHSYMQQAYPIYDLDVQT